MIAKILVGILLLICIVAALLWGGYNQALTTPVVLEQSQEIEIEKGDSFNRITNKLLEQGIVIKPLWFKLIAYKNKVTNKLKAGEYELKPGLSMPEILAIFVAGKSRQYSITFLEGWSFKQVLQQINKTPHIKNTLETSDYQSILTKLDLKYKHPEGLFFPDTYFFEKNTTDLSLLKKAYDKMQRVLTTEWDKKDNNLPLKDAYQALILASIVEKETGAAVERSQIAGVFTRRLNKGMLLQTDPTVIYGMGDSYKGNIRYRDLRQSTPYNTYVIKGLPPTPIAMPGRAAIHAALHPAKGKSLYFVARGDGTGTHVFSATLREHNNAVNKYQRKR
ncbi:MAG: endolytic transglycosylase MltG [Methylococcaceae bacterium]|nr:endolytic transglycosylase MltG [Methylococcaceae bacterium]